MSDMIRRIRAQRRSAWLKEAMVEVLAPGIIAGLVLWALCYIALNS